MTCREVADFLLDYVSEELPLEIRERFERHLAVCPNCRAYIATYRATIELAGQAYATVDVERQPDVPEDLVSAIVGSLRG